MMVKQHMFLSALFSPISKVAQNQKQINRKLPKCLCLALRNPFRSQSCLPHFLDGFCRLAHLLLAFLAKSFHIQRCASVAFPLPLPQLGLFRGGGPKLSHRLWICLLLRKRVLHVVVVAFNFSHHGFSSDVLQQLGRRPNRLQFQMHRRLWSLIATCDSPGEFPISPGRSAPEFIARLFALQQFAASCPLISSGAGCICSLPFP